MPPDVAELSTTLDEQPPIAPDGSLSDVITQLVATAAGRTWWCANQVVMQAAPLSALDLPLKVLVWADGAQTKVTYVAPATLGARHGLSADLTAKLAGIEPLTDALVAP